MESANDNTPQIKIHTAKDYRTVAGYLVLSFGLASAALTSGVVSLPALAIGGGLYATFRILDLKEMKKDFLQDSLKLDDVLDLNLQPSIPNHSRKFSTVLQRFSKILGIKNHPSVRFAKYLGISTKKAAACKNIPLAVPLSPSKGVSDSAFFITRSFCKELSESEAVGSLAHEAGLLACQNKLTKEAVVAPPFVIDLAVFAQMLWFYAASPSGRWGALATAGTIVVAGYASTFFNKRKEIKNPELMSDPTFVTRREKRFLFGTNALLLTIPVAFGVPEISALWLVSKGAGIYGKKINKAFGQDKALQADRIAVSLTRDPASLIKAIQKTEEARETYAERHLKKSKRFGETLLRSEHESLLFPDPSGVRRRVAQLERINATMK
ncbi:MAG TPA: hypothetical protein DD400_03785 [Rhodospirillaceae bacterium]|nr:hypothetical protein [Rhodospirillaceae bacterium]